MKIRTATIACLLILSLISLTLTPAIFAQRSAQGEWAAVQSLSNDEDLSLKLKSGKGVRGKFSSANESELTIIRKGKQEVVARDTIAQIYHLQRKAEKGKYAAIGAGIGAGTGVAIGATKASHTGDDGEIYTVMGVALGAGIGAIGGLLFGQGKRKHVLIYQAP
jgi:hypothetical protein